VPFSSAVQWFRRGAQNATIAQQQKKFWQQKKSLQKDKCWMKIQLLDS